MASETSGWLSTAPVDEIGSCLRDLIMHDLDRARLIHASLERALNDPVLIALASAPVEDELSAEEMEREIAEALKARESEERASAEDAQRQTFE